MKLKAPICKCGHEALQPNKNYSNENSIIWTCSHGHATRITYCSLDEIKLIGEALNENTK